MSMIPIIDAHVHLWDPTLFPMPWLADVPPLNHAFGIDAYARDTMGEPIVGIVVVETGVVPHYALLEAQRLVDLAEHTPAVLGIIVAAPLEFGERTQTYLAALSKLGGLIKGVRCNVQGDPDPDFCLRDGFVAGVHLLAKYDWTCDLCIRPDQLPAVTTLIQRSPQIRFVLDHMGKPPLRLRQLDRWRRDLAQVGVEGRKLSRSAK